MATTTRWHVSGSALTLDHCIGGVTTARTPRAPALQRRSMLHNREHIAKMSPSCKPDTSPWGHPAACPCMSRPKPGGGVSGRPGFAFYDGSVGSSAQQQELDTPRCPPLPLCLCADTCDRQARLAAHELGVCPRAARRPTQDWRLTDVGQIDVLEGLCRVQAPVGHPGVLNRVLLFQQHCRHAQTFYLTITSAD